MDSMLRRFGLKKGDYRETEMRQRHKDLFSFNKCMEHGFPSKVSALAYDVDLDVLIIGTKNGLLRIFGAPGVELTAQHNDNIAVMQIFTFDQGNIITLCSDNSLHLWELAFRDGVSSLEAVKSLSLENRVKTVSASCTSITGDQLLLGSESGHVFFLDLQSFHLLDRAIYQETVTQCAPEDFKVNPGAVEAIVPHPRYADKILIGYNRGLVLLWNLTLNKAEQVYSTSQQLEALSFIGDGKEFISAHTNGSYIIWSSSNSSRPKEQATTVYGPFPCKAITKVLWKTTKTKDPMLIFGGGMPRASFGDRNTVSVIHGDDNHVVFDFTSKVVDFIVVCDCDRRHRLSHSPVDSSSRDEPQALIVLAEEELVAIDLASDNWPTFSLPYLPSLHCSAITCTTHVANVPKTLWDKMADAGRKQLDNYSLREWPIQGGINLLQNVESREMLITGHEDGSIRFWDVSSVSISLIYKLSTAEMFGGFSGRGDGDADEEWPPFRKVGVYDPFSDDPLFAIQKIVMCPHSEMLVVGGTAGQIIVLQFERETRNQEMRYISLNIIGDRDFVWKGHDTLPMIGGEVKFNPGFQPLCVVQLHPPAACTALALHSEWQLVAAGTAHGYGVIDYAQRRMVHSKCTLNPSDLTGVGESTMSRRKSFKKSLRESFRRLRSRRSDRRHKTENFGDPRGASRKPGGADGVSSPARPVGSTGFAVSDELDLARPVERAVEARSADDVSGSIVRTLYFAQTFLMNSQHNSSTLWIGTNSGCVYVCLIQLPSGERRDSDAVECDLAKEIHLKHRAPVISICVIDRNSMPLPAPLEVQNECAKPPDMSGGHIVIISSEEQLKTFSLPNLGTREKFKLTAHEGSKLRKIGYANFRSRSDGSYVESGLIALTNLGEIHVYSIPHLRRQLKAECIRRENLIGIISSVFTQSGEGFYLSSPSEFIRFSVSAHVASRPMCSIRRTEANDADHRLFISEPRRSTSPSHRRTDQLSSASEGIGTDSLSNSANDDSVTSGDTTADSVHVHISDSVVTSSASVRNVPSVRSVDIERGARFNNSGDQ